MNTRRPSPCVLDRRTFVSGAARSLLGVSAFSALPSMASYARTGTVPQLNDSASAKAVIYIYLWGGLSQIDSFDPKPGTDAQGPVDVIDSNVEGLQVSQYFPRMATQMDKVAVIRSMNTNQGEHSQGSYYMRTGYLMNQTTSHPSLGAWTSHFLGRQNSNLPAYVSVGGHQGNRFWGGFLDPQHAALPISDPNGGLRNHAKPEALSDDRFARRLERLRAMNQNFATDHPTRSTRTHVELFDEAVRLMRSEDIDSFDLTKESSASRERYGLNQVGQGCLLAKRLVQRGVRFVEVDFQGWDMHVRAFPKMEERGATLDQSLAALLEDLSTSGMLDDTLVVVATEFGRSPTINPSLVGREHHPQAFTCLLAGGGVAGGQIHGATDEEGREIVRDKVSIPDFNATIAHAIGLPIDEEVKSPTGRPFTVANRGEPVTSLFS